MTYANGTKRRAVTPPARIAFVTHRYAPLVGGIETHVAMLSEALARQGHEVEVLTLRLNVCDPAREVSNGVTVRRFRPTLGSRHYAFSLGLWRYLHAHRDGYDVVHAHNYHALPGFGAAFLSRPAFVFTPHYHGTADTRFRRALHLVYRWGAAAMLSRASQIICVSPREAELLRRHFHLSSDRVAVIPNGVDFDALEAAAPYPCERHAIVCAGRIESYKNVEATIRALPHLRERFLMRVIGEGPDRPRLEHLAQELGVADDCEFLGRVETEVLYRWLRTARVYVTMSKIEAMPVTPLEAMAAGASVVASEIPAHENVLRLSGGAMTLVPVTASAADLAQAITEASERGVSGRPMVSSWTDVAEATGDVYALARADAFAHRRSERHGRVRWSGYRLRARRTLGGRVHG